MLENDPINVDEQQPPTAEPTAAGGVALKARTIDGITAAVAGLVLLAGGGLYAMHTRTAAAAVRMAEVDASATDVDTLLAGGREGISALARSVRSTRDLVARLTTRHDVDESNIQLASAARTPDASTPAERDPFTLKPTEVARPIETKPQTDEPDREQLRNEALAAARQLQVQSILHGSARRSCLINGKLFFEGQAIDSRFTVVSISPDAVIVRSGEFRFELRLRK